METTRAPGRPLELPCETIQQDLKSNSLSALSPKAAIDDRAVFWISFRRYSNSPLSSLSSPPLPLEIEPQNEGVSGALWLPQRV